MRANLISKLFLLLELGIIILSLPSCKSCKKDLEPSTTIASAPLLLTTRGKEVAEEKKSDGVKRIEIGASKRQEDEPVQESGEAIEASKTNESVLPPETVEESDLTERLRNKMSTAYAGREDEMPDVKIYLSNMSYTEFVKYYRDLGYKIKTVAVPARNVIEPVLEHRPDIARKINLSDYDDVVINQVMIDDAGISAADKYIDPDTFEVIDKTFVTKMNRQ